MLINSLSLKNFKCFEELDVKFAPITLLTGANSSGKSSLINAILAVLQTEQFPFYLSPNGKYVNMGSFEEMLWWGTDDSERKIGIDVEFDTHTFHTYSTNWIEDKQSGLPKLNSFNANGYEDEWSILLTDENVYNMSCALSHYFSDPFEVNTSIENIFKNIVISPGEESDSISISNNTFPDLNSLIRISGTYLSIPTIEENPFSPRFNYLGSFRLPPDRTYYQKAKANNRVQTSGDGYIDQIIEWQDTELGTFSKLISLMRKMELINDISTNRIKGGRFELLVKSTQNSDFASLVDIGFGVSQFLPILVADLQLTDESFLAISQPEIHLHPKIQAQFGNYLSNQIKETQKQYIVETHSEYLLNRIRLLLVTGELKPEDVRVLYFENDGVKSTVYDIEFATDGQVKGAPQGFFDTYGIDVMNIAMNAIG